MVAPYSLVSSVHGLNRNCNVLIAWLLSSHAVAAQNQLYIVDSLSIGAGPLVTRSTKYRGGRGSKRSVNISSLIGTALGTSFGPVLRPGRKIDDV